MARDPAGDGGEGDLAALLAQPALKFYGFGTGCKQLVKLESETIKSRRVVDRLAAHGGILSQLCKRSGRIEVGAIHRLRGREKEASFEEEVAKHSLTGRFAIEVRGCLLNRPFAISFSLRRMTERRQMLPEIAGDSVARIHRIRALRVSRDDLRQGAR